MIQIHNQYGEAKNVEKSNEHTSTLEPYVTKILVRKETTTMDASKLRKQSVVSWGSLRANGIQSLRSLGHPSGVGASMKSSLVSSIRVY